MARTFRRKQTVPPISELNLTNLIDLGFTLLIIFMITAPLINEQTIPVNLPVESVSPQQKVDPATRFQTITVLRDGRVQLGSEPMTLAQLSLRLADFAAQPTPPVMRIRSDAEATTQHLISVLDVLKKQNLSKISFDTQTGR